MRTAPTGDDVATPAGPYSPSVRIGAVVACAGQTGKHPDGHVDEDTAGQTRQTLENVRRALAASGAGLEDVIKVQVFLTDADQFDEMNLVYAEYFSTPYPARTTVYVGLRDPFIVEIDALAVLPDSAAAAAGA
jgi:2-iminobutanoate/2-iminopropanoate deaminase